VLDASLYDAGGKLDMSSSKGERAEKQVASASKVQTQGIQQITKAIHELDEATQHNAAEADQQSQLTQEMEQQAEQLSQCVSTLIHLIKGVEEQRQEEKEGPKLLRG